MTQKEYFRRKLIITANIAHFIYKIINDYADKDYKL